MNIPMKVTRVQLAVDDETTTRCFACHRVFQPGESWWVYTSGDARADFHEECQP